jgi:large subunit ribosomal protein L23
MRDKYRAIVRPVITEKSSAAYSYRKEYTFRADPRASKRDIKDAIESLYPVRVVNVRTLVQPSKRKTLGRSAGRRPKWKKAFVTLHRDDTIEDIFES